MHRTCHFLLSVVMTANKPAKVHVKIDGCVYLLYAPQKTDKTPDLMVLMIFAGNDFVFHGYSWLHPHNILTLTPKGGWYPIAKPL